jgi:hypothetical protein
MNMYECVYACTRVCVYVCGYVIFGYILIHGGCIYIFSSALAEQEDAAKSKAQEVHTRADDLAEKLELMTKQRDSLLMVRQRNRAGVYVCVCVCVCVYARMLYFPYMWS